MNKTTSPSAPLYRLNRLPAAIVPEITAKENELAAMKTWKGIAKLVGAAAAIAFGLLGMAYSIFYTLIPWIYGVSVVAVGIGGAAFKKFWTERKEGPKVIEEWKKCEADLTRGTPFRQFLEAGKKKELSWEKILETHRQFHQAFSSIN